MAWRHPLYFLMEKAFLFLYPVEGLVSSLNSSNTSVYGPNLVYEKRKLNIEAEPEVVLCNTANCYKTENIDLKT